MAAQPTGPPRGLEPVASAIWAIRQSETATSAGQIRAPTHVVTANGPHAPQRSFVLSVRRRLLEVGATLPDDAPTSTRPYS